MNRLRIIAFLAVSMVPLHAHAQQPDIAQLKTDAQKVVSIIRGDKARSQAYCQINNLGEEIDLGAQARDEQKVDALTKKINDLEQRVGPEYIALIDALNNVDEDLNDFQDIMSIFENLDKSCAH
jgi:ABC-type transporter Mla subunit MlaD